MNMALIQAGHQCFPVHGIDVNDMDALAEAMPTLDLVYFIFPFLAHALGTFTGATLSGWIATKHKMKFALSIGALFLLGGITINFMLPGPTWFTIVDIVIAYIPMAWLGGKIALTISQYTSV